MFLVTVDFCIIFCFKQKTAYEMRISDWSSDVCSSDLRQSVAAAFRERAARMGVALACVSAADADAARAASKTCFHSRRHHLNSAARARPARPTRMEWIETWVIGWWSPRSEERRVGKEWGSTYGSGW